jgi:hypothetical protein
MVVYTGTNTRHWSDATRATTSSHDNCCATESDDGRRSWGAPFMFSREHEERKRVRGEKNGPAARRSAFSFN